MKISNKFQTFKEPSLIVICNFREAIFYRAENRNLEKIAEFKISKPEYSDREDFGRLSTGGVFETGGRFEKEKAILSKDFKEKFSETTSSIAKTNAVKKLYIFSAKNIHNLLVKLIPSAWKPCLAANLKGDYTKKHPFEILEILKNGNGSEAFITG